MRRGAVVVDEGSVGGLTEAVTVVGSIEGLAEAVVAGVNTVDAFVAENIDVGTTSTENISVIATLPVRVQAIVCALASRISASGKRHECASSDGLHRGLVLV